MSDAESPDWQDTPPTDATRSSSSSGGGDVRQRAYDLYAARGGADGDDVADWLAAERELELERGTTGHPDDMTEEFDERDRRA